MKSARIELILFVSYCPQFFRVFPPKISKKIFPTIFSIFTIPPLWVENRKKVFSQNLLESSGNCSKWIEKSISGGLDRFLGSFRTFICETTLFSHKLNGP